MTFDSFSNANTETCSQDSAATISFADVFGEKLNKAKILIDDRAGDSPAERSDIDDYKDKVKVRVESNPDEKESWSRNLLVPSLDSNHAWSSDTIALQNKLTNDAQKLDTTERTKFLNDMNSFLDRAATLGLDEKSEVDKTLQNCDSLLNPQGTAFIDGAPQGRSLRLMLAEQVMSKAAFPSTTDQGVFGTCTIASLETRTWFAKPSVASGLIAEQALSGHWTAPDGKQIVLPAIDFKPDKYSQQTVAKNGMRNYAGQIFQATAMSDIGSRGHVHEGQEEFYVDGGTTASGSGIEYWADANGNKVNKFNGLDDIQTAEELKRMCGDNTVVFCSAPSKPDDHVLSFTSKEDLIQKLVEAQEQGKMPVTFVVATGDRLFGGNGEHKLNHAICIDKYDPVTRTLVLDNQWGSKYDWGTETVKGSPADRNPVVSIDDFYPATQEDHEATSLRKKVQLF